MALYDMMLTVLERSGLLPLWEAVAPWLALDERQLIFMVATPVFIGVALWEYLRIRHDPALMDTREAVRNFALGAGYQVTELLFAGVIAFPLYALCYHYRLFELELSWLTAVLTFVGVWISASTGCTGRAIACAGSGPPTWCTTHPSG